MEHLDQLYSRFDFALYHVLRRAQQEKFHSSVEHALYPGIVVDPRVGSHGVTFHRTSVKIHEIAPSSRDVFEALSFRGVNGTYLLMECQAMQI
jgi:hypothetical protein